MGFNGDQFWSLTPSETKLWMEGAGERLRREYNERVFLAWTVAALQRQKRMPRLKSLLKHAPTKDRPKQTWQHMSGLMEFWAAEHNKRFGTH